MAGNDLVITLVSCLVFMALVGCLTAAEPETDPVTKLIKAENWELVSANCMACHSTKGFTQVGQDRANWERTIRDMQKKHGLWPLGDMEPKIPDYLEKNYG